LNPASSGVDNPPGTRLSVSSHHTLPGILLARNASLHIVVAGGAGMIGSHLCEELVGRGHFVTCLDNLCTGRLVNLEPIRDHSRFRFLLHDVIEPLPPVGHVDRVFNLASPASPPGYTRLPLETMRVNSEGTRRLIELAL